MAEARGPRPRRGWAERRPAASARDPRFLTASQRDPSCATGPEPQAAARLGAGPAGAACRRSASCDWLARGGGRALEWGREAGPLSRSRCSSARGRLLRGGRQVEGRGPGDRPGSRGDGGLLWKSGCGPAMFDSGKSERIGWNTSSCPN